MTYVCYVKKMDYVQATENTISRCMESCEVYRNYGVQGLRSFIERMRRKISKNRQLRKWVGEEMAKVGPS